MTNHSATSQNDSSFMYTQRVHTSIKREVYFNRARYFYARLCCFWATNIRINSESALSSVHFLTKIALSSVQFSKITL